MANTPNLNVPIAQSNDAVDRAHHNADFANADAAFGAHRVANPIDHAAGSVDTNHLALGAATGPALGADVVVTTGTQTIGGAKTFLALLRGVAAEITANVGYAYTVIRTASAGSGYFGLGIDGANGAFMLDDVQANRRRLTIYPSGGISFGVNPVVDPGADNVQIQGTLTATNLQSKIAKTVLGSSASTITVSGIPQTYENLEIRAGLFSVDNTSLAVNLTFNNDSAAHYLYTYTSPQPNAGAVNFGGTPTPDHAIQLGSVSGTYPYIQGLRLDVTGYAVAGAYPALTWQMTGQGSTNASSASFAGGGAYLGSSITSVTLTIQAGHQFATGSWMSVYALP